MIQVQHLTKAFPARTAVSDVSLQDVLDPALAYVAGSMRYDDSQPSCALMNCTTTEETAIFAAVDSGTPGSDDEDGDVVSYAATTVDAGDQNAGNARLDIPAGRVWALVLAVRVH